MNQTLTSVRTYAIGFVLFSTMIIAHELGHTLTALLLGEKVISFNLGFGPELWSSTLFNVKLTIRAIFIGGYVILPEIFSIPSYKAFLIFVAGGVVNIVFGLALLSFVVKRQSPIRLLQIPVLIFRAVMNAINLVQAGKNLYQAIILRLNARKKNKEEESQNDDVKITSVNVTSIDDNSQKSINSVKSNKFSKTTTEKTCNVQEEKVTLSINPFPMMKQLGTGSVKDIIETFAIISIFTGVLNLMPLPLFDGSKYVLLFLRIVTGQKVAEIALAMYAIFFLSFMIFGSICNATANLIRPAAEFRSYTSTKDEDVEIFNFFNQVVLYLYNQTSSELTFEERYRQAVEEFPAHMSKILQKDKIEMAESTIQAMKVYVESIRSKIYEQIKQNK